MGNLGLLTRSALVVMPRADRELIITSTHEAGHAVAATLLRCFFERVELGPGHAGRLHYGEQQRYHGGHHYWLRRSAVALGGDAGVKLLWGGHDSGANRDYHNAEKYLGHVVDNPPSVATLFTAVSELLDPDLTAVADVAEALLERGQLSYAEVRALVNQYEVAPYSANLAKILGRE